MRAVWASLLVLAIVLGPGVREDNASLAAVPAPLAADDLAVSRYDLRRTGVSPDAFDIPWEFGWSFLTNGTSATSALAADVDGDGELELFFGETRSDGADRDERQGYVVDRHGRLRYAVRTYDDSYAAGAADLDGDGRPELVFAVGSLGQPDRMGYRVFHGHDGSPAWNVTLLFALAQHVTASPALDDVDGDGLIDLIAASTDGSVYAFRGTDGSVLWQTSLSEVVVSRAPPIDDLDGDGRREVVVSTESGRTYVLDAGTGAERWSFDADGSPIALAELDGDGRLEIVICGSGGLAAVRPNGTVLWRGSTYSVCGRTPTLVDVDGDGVRDIVGVGAAANRLVAWNGTDGGVIWDVEYAHVRGFQPLVASIMDEGRMFILVPESGSYWAKLWLHSASSGGPLWIIIVTGGEFFYGEPLVRDLAGDGLAELALATGDGRLYLVGSRADAPSNRPPIADAGLAYVAAEGDVTTLSAAASTDPDGDPLTFRWDLDGDGTWDTAWSSDPTTTYTWGDDWAGTVRVEVSDGTLSSTADAAVRIQNRDPVIGEVRVAAIGDLTLRAAGEKWHDVRLEIVQGAITETLSVTRMPGSPDDQSATFEDVEFDLTQNASITVYYTPDDDPVNGQPNGANPVWVIFNTTMGEVRLHHTFNVQHPETYVWTLNDVLAQLVGGSITFSAFASDVGSDDLTVVWDFGDGSTATASYYNDGVGPDPFPSPEVNPTTVTDVVAHAYMAAGTYTVTVVAIDDDGGIVRRVYALAVGP